MSDTSFWRREAPYYVWRRNDGLVSSTRYKPNDCKGANGEVTTFEHLGVFEDWAEAARLIENERQNA